MISPDAVGRLGLAVDPREIDGEHYPAVVDGPKLPADFPAIPDMLIVGDMPSYADGADGLLGQVWHTDHV